MSENKEIIEIDSKDLKVIDKNSSGKLRPGTSSGGIFSSFYFKSVSVRFDGKDTHVSSRRVSMKNNEVSQEEFEGTIEGNSMFDQIIKAQTSFFRTFLSLFNPAAFLKNNKKDK